MHESKKTPKKIRRPVKTSKIGVPGLLALLSLIFTLVVLGQQGANVPKKELLDRLDDGVSVKEPGFKRTAKRQKTAEDTAALLGWTSGDDYVSATTYEYASPQEAAAQLQATINAPASVPSDIKKLNIGDEGYERAHGAYSKAGATSVFFRRGNVMIVLSASSPEIAKRFAKHLVDEIDQP
ncbi:MAG TPA: hypothetical protein VE961_13420 [Pyrinomonadaceae bacterium]|nr:hypothetical protein [Pyrinomonadaceae bacterium]